MSDVAKVTLDFWIGSRGAPYEYLDPATADEDEIRYYLFHGDIEFQVGDVDFSTKWGWVPVLDFAIFMARISASLAKGEPTETFGFTESAAEIHFVRDGRSARVTTSYEPGVAHVDLIDFAAASTQLFERAYQAACLAEPRFTMNPIGLAWLHEVRARST